MQQECLKDARLLSWSKEIAVPGVEGQLINQLLEQALARQGLTNIEPSALVNDTTALLLSAAYTMERVRMGVVCGTGFNACYYEPAWDMIVNLEAGDYGGLVRNRWDKAVDALSTSRDSICWKRRSAGLMRQKSSGRPCYLISRLRICRTFRQPS